MIYSDCTATRVVQGKKPNVYWFLSKALRRGTLQQLEGMCSGSKYSTDTPLHRGRVLCVQGLILA